MWYKEEGNLQAAEAVVKLLREKYPKELHVPDVARALSSVDLRAQFVKEHGASADGGAAVREKQEEFKRKLKENPNDHKSRYDLAFSLFSAGQTNRPSKRCSTSSSGISTGTRRLRGSYCSSSSMRWAQIVSLPRRLGSALPAYGSVSYQPKTVSFV